ncbi:hypothetical protein WAI453_001114 [Rhynchosporium graminicola]
MVTMEGDDCEEYKGSIEAALPDFVLRNLAGDLRSISGRELEDAVNDTEMQS